MAHSPDNSGDAQRLPFAPRDRERFVITIVEGMVSVVSETANSKGGWTKFNELWYTPKEFYILLARWYERQPKPTNGRLQW